MTANDVTHTAGGLTLIAGGARSGKSRGAAELALALNESSSREKPVLVATAQPFDDEMRERIARHRHDRADRFRLVEEPLRLVDTLTALTREPTVGVVLVDCLTLWLTNALLAGWDEAAVVAELRALLALHRPFHTIIVTNEVGLGLVPDTPLGRLFRDVAGRAHQLLAARADHVYFALLGGLVHLRPGPMLWHPPKES